MPPLPPPLPQALHRAWNTSARPTTLAWDMTRSRLLPVLQPAQVRTVVARQFPGLGSLPVSALGEGSDHLAFAVGPSWVFRFPKRVGGGEALRTEARLLRGLAPHLTLPVPVPVFVGQPSALFPEAFTGAARLTGTPGLTGPPPDPVQTGHALGQFLRRLHAQNAARATGVVPDFEPTYADWQVDALKELDAAQTQVPDAQRWRGVLGQPPTSQPERLTVLHGDLAAEHVMVGGGGEITGILDWSDASLGDPARDLAGLIGWAGRAMLDAALTQYGSVEAGFVRRAAWYAACRAVADIAFGIAQARPEYVRGGRRALTLLETEFAHELGT